MKTINKILAIGIVLCIILSIGCINQEPVPKYVTVFTLGLDDSGIFGTYYKIENVYDFDYIQTGTDLWDNTEYMFDVYYYIGNEKFHKRYYEINSFDISNKHNIMVGYK